MKTIILKVLKNLINNIVFWINLIPAIYLTSQYPIESISFIIGCINWICVTLIIKDCLKNVR